MLKNINDYLQNITQVKSADDLLANDKLLNFALVAHGFTDEVIDKRTLKAILEGGIDDPKSPANQHPDKRFAALAASFNFARYGEDATTYNATQSPAIDKYLRQTLEEDAGKQNEGVRLALYFQRKAPSIRSYYEFLADPAIAKVMRSTLGFPDALAQANIDKQVDLIKERIDIEDFKDPEKVDEFLKRFTTMWEMSNPSGSQLPSIAALYSQPAEYGISTDVLFTIAQLKR